MRIKVLSKVFIIILLLLGCSYQTNYYFIENPKDIFETKDIYPDDFFYNTTPPDSLYQYDFFYTPPQLKWGTDTTAATIEIDTTWILEWETDTTDYKKLFERCGCE